MCLQLFVSQFLTSYILKLNLVFSSSGFPTGPKNVGTETELPSEHEELLKWNKKDFSSLFKAFH